MTFKPFLAYYIEIRKPVYSTNAIESINARTHRAVNIRRRFPTDQAVFKCDYTALLHWV